MNEITSDNFKTALNEVAATDAGKIVIAMLKESCQWDETYLSSDNPQVTQFYAVKRGIYGGLRKLIKTEYLKEIEYNYKIKVENERNTEPRQRPAKPSDRPRRASQPASK